MKELIEFIAKSLVENPDAVTVNEELDEEGAVLIKLSAAQEDMGRIIGKQGRTVRALRTLIDAAGEKFDRHYAVEVIE